MSVEFGLLLHTRHLIRDGQAADFSSLWTQAAAAERAGFDHVWIGDSVTTLDRARGDCLTTLAALAMATENVGIGVVPLLASLRDPVLLAHALATLDVISRGRLRVVASAGPNMDHIRHQFAACGVPPEEKAGRLGECLTVMRRLWTEDRIDFDGRYFKLEDTGILPKPLQSPTIPVWLASEGNERALRRVGRLADGWATTTGDVARFRELRRTIDSHAVAYGRRAEDVAPSMLYATFNIADDRAKAEEDGWGWMVDFFRRPRERLEGMYTPIFDTPEGCARTLRAFRDAGMTSVVARLASEDAERQTRLLLDEVKPRLSAP